MRYWAIQNGAEQIGYFCGGLVQKGPFKILGSPLKGWGTNFLGPVHDERFDQQAFIRALDDLARRESIAMVEIEGRGFSESPMENAGYHAVVQPTYVVALTPDDAATMWKRIDLKSRQKIRKAKRAGLTLEDTEDPAIVDEFFDEFVEVLSRKNLYPPYDRSCPRLLFRQLKSQDSLLSLSVRIANGRIIATGLFPHDEKTLYFWGGASRMDAWHYSPNDLLQWNAMEIAAARRLTAYNMCGYGYFKSKFGGELLQLKRWHKFYSRSGHWARKGYEFYFKNRIRLRGLWARVGRDGAKD
jgi:CelD/BcsL family acetyltransferase involved in cellulose biosynthesis